MNPVFEAISTSALVALIVFIAIAVFIFYRVRYKIVQANEVLVISGGREKMKKGKDAVEGDIRRERSSIRILRAGGAFVSPFKKWDKFSLSVMTIQSEGQNTQSAVIVPVVVKWTAQIKADDTTNESLEKAITNFLGFRRDSIEEALKQSLDGEVRAVIGTKTPEEIVTDKNAFGKEVRDGVQDKMSELGFKLLSLNIAEVSDPNDYYTNLAAKDREAKRRDAENLRAEAERDINKTAAATSKESEEARLSKDLAIAEKQRDVDVKKAEFYIQKSEKEAEAAFARQIRDEAQKQELELRKGDVAVTTEEQRRRAAEAHQTVAVTEAETEKKKRIIEAEASARKAEIDAAARVVIAERDADADAKAAEIRATGEAVAVQRQAEGKAIARREAAAAEAEYIRQTRAAQAAGIEAEGKAEAEAIRQKGLAEAEAEMAKAEALAEKEGVNLRVTLAEIESRTRIQVSNAIATAVAEVGTNATIIDMGSGGGSEGDDLLTGFLKKLPAALAQMDVASGALNGKAGASLLNELSAAIFNKPAQAEGEPSRLTAAAAGIGAAVSSLGDRGEGDEGGSSLDSDEDAEGDYAAEAIGAGAGQAGDTAAGNADADSGTAGDTAAGQASADSGTAGDKGRRPAEKHEPTDAANTAISPAERQAEIYKASDESKRKTAAKRAADEAKKAEAAKTQTAQAGQAGQAGQATQAGPATHTAQAGPASQAAQAEPTTHTAQAGPMAHVVQAGPASQAAQAVPQAAEAASAAPEHDPAAHEDPALLAEAQAATAGIAENYHLDEEDALEVAQVYADIHDSVGDNGEKALDLAEKTINAIRVLRRQGKRVDIKSVAHVVIGLDSENQLNTDNIIDRLGKLAKKAVKNRVKPLR